MATGPIIRLEGVSKRFGQTAALDDVSLEVNEGEFFALLGPSGCGKTTLLRLLAGFETPDRGRILIDGEDVGATPPNRRPVNMVFQSYAVFPHMSVAANVGYGLRMDGAPAAERRQRVEEALALVHLDGLGERRPDQISGGQRQRVALARALVKRPRVLLLDEPLSALDAKLREQMRFELAQLQRTVGITFVMVTHDQSEALALADRAAVMDQGVLRQVSTPEGLYERPASRFVADFIGQVNLFEATLVECGPGHARADCPELGAPVHQDRAVQGVTPGAQVWVGLRPERIDLHRRAAETSVPGRHDSPAGCNRAAGTVRRIAYQGGESLYEVELDSGRRMRARRGHANADDSSAPGLDEAVWLTWPASAPGILLS